MSKSRKSLMWQAPRLKPTFATCTKSSISPIVKRPLWQLGDDLAVRLEITVRGEEPYRCGAVLGDKRQCRLLKVAHGVVTGDEACSDWKCAIRWLIGPKKWPDLIKVSCKPVDVLWVGFNIGRTGKETYSWMSDNPEIPCNGFQVDLTKTAGLGDFSSHKRRSYSEHRCIANEGACRPRKPTDQLGGTHYGRKMVLCHKECWSTKISRLCLFNM